MSRDIEFSHLQEIYSRREKLLDIATKTGLDAAKGTSKEIFHKIAEARGELTGDKVTEKVVKPKLVTLKILRNREEIVFYTKEKLRNTERIETKIIKCNTMKSLNYFKNQLYPSLWQEKELKWMIYQIVNIQSIKI